MFPIPLDKPLIVFDIEATGISPRSDRIVELAAIRLEPDGTEVSGYWLLNPGVPIPVETTAIHGITDAIVAGQPTFKDKALEILAFFGDADFAGFNAGRYDIPMLSEEFARAGVPFDADRRRLLDAQRIFHTREPRDLSAALAFYCGRAHTDAHGAEADVRATLDVILGQFKKYGDLPKDMDTIDRTFNPVDPFSVDRAGRLRWVDGEATVNFGKKKGARLKDLIREDPGFLRWITKNDFPQDTRAICENALKGIFPVPPRLRASGAR
ncbi:MAG: 3'-5' exonuclease [Verrucomicrobiota bacterium]|jgi:DNA polymerase-3 subunit epsilon|nr:3'-5' exonuclease [Verrucomicrobiota bacterium]